MNTMPIDIEDQHPRITFVVNKGYNGAVAVELHKLFAPNMTEKEARDIVTNGTMLCPKNRKAEVLTMLRNYAEIGEISVAAATHMDRDLEEDEVRLTFQVPGRHTVDVCVGLRKLFPKMGLKEAHDTVKYGVLICDKWKREEVLKLLRQYFMDAATQKTPDPVDPTIIMDHIADGPKATCCDFAPDMNDLPTYLRHLKGSHPDLTDDIEAKTNELATMVRGEWTRVFGGPLKVDFVCNNPQKIALLRGTMQISDLVPMIFGMDPDPNYDQTRFRVLIEL